MPRLVEVADRVWVGRYEWADVNITAIGSERGLVVVDTHGSTVAGRAVVDDVERIGAGPVAHVVNSHWHWDHSFGNAAFREAVPGVPIHGHEETAVWMAERAESVKARFGESSDDPHGAEVGATEIVPPDRTFAERCTLDLGDRAVELEYRGRAHTSGDVVVGVPDVDLLIAGDLVEESDHPWIGPDSWPLEWPATLDKVLDLVTEQTVVIPGHGVAVDRAFVLAQREELAQIARMIEQLAASGVPADRAVAEGEWPWDVDVRIHNAVARGYETAP